MLKSLNHHETGRKKEQKQNAQTEAEMNSVVAFLFIKNKIYNLDRTMALTNNCVNIADRLVQMLKDIVEGISPGDIDVSRFESRTVFDGANWNARSDDGRGSRL